MELQGFNIPNSPLSPPARGGGKQLSDRLCIPLFALRVLCGE
jgi:hypothetical protein